MSSNLFWIDLEMTGLNVETEVIIEAAAIITDSNFKELATYETVVKQPQIYLDRMDDWNKKHHGESGLSGKVPSGKDPSDVQSDLIQLVTEFFPDKKDKPILAGNSIGQDRLFINKDFPDFAQLLHYRMLDVTSWKIVFNARNIEFKKQNKHRALDDIRESINELKFYMSHLKL
ncbi:MAG: oligoribonuclease [Bdellovibrionaceae bacterium]|nr:oligoribonuclease [Pseudobdellovibrionaceae bacterium]